MPHSSAVLLDKTRGCLYGGAIGDALGSPAEWRTPDEIRARFGELSGFVEPWAGPSPIGKGSGRYSDDTHMVQLLGRLYVETGGHLDAFSFARGIVPLIADEPRWLPERGQEMPLVERLFYPEKWLVMRLRLANADPRLGGVGNMVNCGAAMYAAPVGIVNAADPDAAYREAIDCFAAHQWSYGLEAAGVVAACVAAAFAPDATPDTVAAVALRLANDGTKRALAAVLARARGFADWRDAIAPLRDAIRPFDGSAEDGRRDRGNGTDDWGPSREKSIEELPIALALLLVAQGDPEQTVLAGANYGRDNDSIAGIAGAIAGALHGAAALRPAWIETINTANRIDLDPLARDLAALAHTLQQRQLAAAQERARAFERLAAPASARVGA